MNWTKFKKAVKARYTHLRTAGIGLGPMKALAKGVMVFGVIVVLGAFFVSELRDTFTADTLPYNIANQVLTVLNTLVTTWLPILVTVTIIAYALAYLNVI